MRVGNKEQVLVDSALLRRVRHYRLRLQEATHCGYEPETLQVRLKHTLVLSFLLQSSLEAPASTLTLTHEGTLSGVPCVPGGVTPRGGTHELGTQHPEQCSYC